MERKTPTSKTKTKTRTSTPRNKSGCHVCRQRHLKCDEARPACVRCTRAGWPCSYADTTTTPTSITRYAIPFTVPGSQKDRQTLHYYCVRGAGELAGGFNLDFWSRVVLQQSHGEPVVRQALVSLGMLHLEFTTKTTTRVEVLGQYGRTLRMLKRRLDNPDGAVKTAIVCCILFCCFEAACNNYSGATSHLQNGLEMLKRLDDADFDVLSRMLGGLDVQASLLNDSRVPQLSSNLYEPFTTLDEAYHGLMKLQNRLLRSFITTRRDVPAPALDEKDTLSRDIHLWLQQYNQIEFTDKQKAAAQMLIFHHKVADMFLEASYPANAAAVFEASPNPRVEAILDLAEDVLKYSPSSTGTSLTSETGVVAPLFALALKCSDDHVRSRVLQLLGGSDRREGLYDTKGMAKTVQEFITAREERQVFNEQSSNEVSIRHLDL